MTPTPQEIEEATRMADDCDHCKTIMKAYRALQERYKVLEEVANAAKTHIDEWEFPTLDLLSESDPLRILWLALCKLDAMEKR